MDMNELKGAWQSLDGRMARNDEMLASLLTNVHTDRARRVVGWLMFGQVLGIAIWGAVAALAGPFWIAHRGDTHLLLAGLTLHLYAIVAICAGVIQFLLSLTIRFDRPVAALQHDLARLRRLRVWSTVILGLPWWFLWLVITLVAAKWLLGIDLYAASPGWVQVSLAIGLAGMALTVWIGRRLAQSPKPPQAVTRFIEGLAGCLIEKASREVREAARLNGP